MDYFHENNFSENDFSDSEEEEIGEYPDWLKEEDKIYYNLDIINDFKNLLDKEPNFYGIKKLSDVDILIIFENDRNKKNNKIVLSFIENRYFDELWLILFNFYKSDYSGIANNIINKIKYY